MNYTNWLLGALIFLFIYPPVSYVILGLVVIEGVTAWLRR